MALEGSKGTTEPPATPHPGRGEGPPQPPFPSPGYSLRTLWPGVSIGPCRPPLRPQRREIRLLPGACGAWARATARAAVTHSPSWLSSRPFPGEQPAGERLSELPGLRVGRRRAGTGLGAPSLRCLTAVPLPAAQGPFREGAAAAVARVLPHPEPWSPADWALAPITDPAQAAEP